jgi:hypothetical protein
MSQPLDDNFKRPRLDESAVVDANSFDNIFLCNYMFTFVDATFHTVMAQSSCGIICQYNIKSFMFDFGTNGLGRVYDIHMSRKTACFFKTFEIISQMTSSGTVDIILDLLFEQVRIIVFKISKRPTFNSRMRRDNLLYYT